MRVLLLILCLLPVGLKAALYTATWNTVPGGNNITDNPPGGTSEGDWTVDIKDVGGSITIENNASFGSNVARINTNGAFWATAANTKTAYTDVKVTAKIDNTSGDRSYIGVRVDGSTNTAGQQADGYHFEYIHSLTLARIFESTVSGMSIVLASTTTSVPDKTNYTISISTQGTTIKGFLNGTEILSTTDGTFTSGGIAMTTFGSTTDWDDLTVIDNTAVGDYIIPSAFQKITDFTKTTSFQKVP